MLPSGNTILITGGGQGIGRALAQRWHDRGNNVIVTGRRRETLNEAIRGRPQMTASTLDVDDPHAIKAFAQRVVAQHPELNVLVNNAGIMRVGDLTSERDMGDGERTIVTNLLGPLHMTDALIGHLKGRPGAAVVNVSSGLAFVPLPATPTYSATKAAIHSYTASLRARFAGRVEIIEIIPPGVQTELTPGQSEAEGYMPLEAYADEVMALLEQRPTPPEICVEAVKLFRNAEAEGRFDDVLAILNTHA